MEPPASSFARAFCSVSLRARMIPKVCASSLLLTSYGWPWVLTWPLTNPSRSKSMVGTRKKPGSGSATNWNRSTVLP